ncbi:hypothetical protein FHT60_003909 [Novosphingobium sp. BK486]|nr:hypothetical protein [Novosphingobium sp. BK256]MBB3376423.1 hypothetical protein [Novosphingobium sp. BK280]MBB3380861.1 hypothetical protein [Novosphingobium sp. BK258]MBB3422487.1 hypothetical protein [Novosphingobium sp. BK267]MBB3451212.1 hypothetical protein [Novosphingobium sp. BK352]MBB3479720.1 hypothetical protein [Novosphingobium sp. BK369]MBB3503034.1 hypothetical protein [Novosphingobium sp. BK336]MBB3538796.1 hypothetical protein [Novosphingobium sp. BK486]MBB3558191.1 hypo
MHCGVRDDAEDDDERGVVHAICSERIAVLEETARQGE